MRPGAGCVLLWASSRKSSSLASFLPRGCFCLAARSEPFDQRKGQAGFRHSFLNSSNIVWHAPKFNDLMFLVGDGKRSSRIPISRLADGAWIQQIPRTRFHTQGGEFRPMIRAQLNHADFPVAVGKTA